MKSLVLKHTKKFHIRHQIHECIRLLEFRFNKCISFLQENINNIASNIIDEVCTNINRI